MFFSQRVSDRRQRLANPSLSDRSWRTQRPLSMQRDIKEDNDAADELQPRKRSRTHATTTPAPFDRRSLEFRPKHAGRPNSEGERSSHPVSTPEPVATKEEIYRVPRFVQDLRKSLLENDENNEQPVQAIRPAQSTSTPKTGGSRNDSVISQPVIGRKRRHSFHVPPTSKQDLAATRADIVRMGKEREVTRAEISLLSEMYHQECYLTAHKRDGGSIAYRRMATTLTQNRIHLSKYKRHEAEWRDLPASVRDRMGDVAEPGIEVMPVLPQGIIGEAVETEDIRVGPGRRMSEQMDWVSVELGRAE